LFLVISVLAFTMTINYCNERSIPVLNLEKAPGTEFYTLFNGTDFRGWNITPDKGAWCVKDGMIRCKGKPREPYLIRTEREYENFDFYADFRISKECNSGIFFHIPLAGRESRLGFEAQILDDNGKKPDKTSSGSIYDVVPPFENAMKPAGEWNQYRIFFDWPKCEIWLNGNLIQDTDFSVQPVLKYRLRRGPIALSNHGYPVEYKNLWIKELPDKERWISLFNGKDLTGWTSVGDADWHVENGLITATRGEGYLVTDQEFKSFEFQAYVDNDTLLTRDGCIYYRWENVTDPGYEVAFFDYQKALKYTRQYKDKIPETVVPPWKYSWILYHIISTDRESEIRTNGDISSKNRLLGKARPGKIAFYHSPTDSIIRIQQIRIKKLEGMGI